MTDADLQEQFTLAQQISDKVTAANEAVLRIRNLKDQIADRAWAKTHRREDQGGGAVADRQADGDRRGDLPVPQPQQPGPAQLPDQAEQQARGAAGRRRELATTSRPTSPTRCSRICRRGSTQQLARARRAREGGTAGDQQGARRARSSTPIKDGVPPGADDLVSDSRCRPHRRNENENGWTGCVRRLGQPRRSPQQGNPPFSFLISLVRRQAAVADYVHARRSLRRRRAALRPRRRGRPGFPSRR